MIWGYVALAVIAGATILWLYKKVKSSAETRRDLQRAERLSVQKDKIIGVFAQEIDNQVETQKNIDEIRAVKSWDELVRVYNKVQRVPNSGDS